MVRAASVREKLRAGAAWAVVAVATWQGLVGAARAAADLARRPRADHLRVLSATPEELIERRLGPDSAVWQAVRAHVPEPGLVHVSFRDRREDYFELRRRLTRLESLLYPIVLKGWPYDPERAARGAPLPADSPGYVLDLDSGRDFSAWSAGIERARGAGWRLLGSAPVAERAAGDERAR